MSNPNQEHFYLSKDSKQNLLKQKAHVFWLTGLSGAGKTTITGKVEAKLHDLGFLIKIFDGDLIRKTINKDLDFSDYGRTENIRRVAAINNEFINCGVIVMNCFISPTNSMRQMAREIIGDENFSEIYVKCSVSICEKRDPKGLYQKARAGEIKHFTGIDSVYEEPKNPELILDTENNSIDECVNDLLNYILNKIKF
ncbi:MAG: adenylyl-sulfate kinase [Bacteroidales bacterium]|nr:adenylyl-sulfate kinase [Bacteroidales bacterium]